MNKHSDAYFCPSPYDRELLLSELSKFFETKFRKLLTMSDASRSEMLNSLNTLTEISARGLFIALPCSVREICRFLSSFSSRVRTT